MSKKKQSVIIWIIVWMFMTGFGIHHIIQGVRERLIRGNPPVSGIIKQRQKTSVLGLGLFSRTRFLIEVEETGEEVEAITGSYLYEQVPDTASFYFSGKPSREVFLFQYEEDPLWIGLACTLGFSLLLPCLPWASRKLRCASADRTNEVAQQELSPDPSGPET